MPNLNKVLLMGNLTRDPELRVTPKGTSVCAFGLAVNRVFRTEGAESQEETTFVDVEAWGKQAELISKYVSKGNPLFVEGRLRLDSWESKEGDKRSKMKVVLENMQFLGGRSDGGQSKSAAGGDSYSPPQRATSSPKATSSEDIEEDVPF